MFKVGDRVRVIRANEIDEMFSGAEVGMTGTIVDKYVGIFGDCNVVELDGIDKEEYTTPFLAYEQNIELL